MGKNQTLKAASASAQLKMDSFTTFEAAPSKENPGVAPTPIATDLSTILNAISASQASVEGKIGEIKVDVSLLRQDLRNATSRIAETENRISSAEDDILHLKEQVAQLRTRTGELHRRAEDAENRARRNNLRLVGFPEGIETAGAAALRIGLDLGCLQMLSLPGLSSSGRIDPWPPSPLLEHRSGP